MDGICLSFDFLIDVREPHPESFGTATRRIKLAPTNKRDRAGSKHVGIRKKIGEASSSSWFKVIFFYQMKFFLKALILINTFNFFLIFKWSQQVKWFFFKNEKSWMQYTEWVGLFDSIKYFFYHVSIFWETWVKKKNWNCFKVIIVSIGKTSFLIFFFFWIKKLLFFSCLNLFMIYLAKSLKGKWVCFVIWKHIFDFFFLLCHLGKCF